MKRLPALFLALALLLAGCAPAPARTSPTAESVFFAMDTVMTLRLYQGGDEALLGRAQARVEELEGLLSVTGRESEIYALNHGGQAALSPDTADLLELALGMCGRTDGALDVSVYPVLRAWGFTTGEYAVPDADTIADLLTRVDYTRVVLDETAGAASLPEGVEVDLGGNIQTVGTKPDGTPWRIGVRDPEGDDILGVVEVIDKAVVTSGGYERYFEKDGVRYWHIIDPATGAPARSALVSVTVIGDSGLTCDALSTALFVMGLDGALEHWREYRDFEAVFVCGDGSVTVTAGLEDSFALNQTDRIITVARP